MKIESTTARLIITASLGLLISGCSEKTTSTTAVNPDGTQTTTVTEKKGLDTKTTVTTTPAPDGDDGADPNESKKIKIDVSTGKDTADGADRVHVRGPGIKIDSNDSDESVDIKLPFVKVKKDGDGHVHVKTPFVNIESNDN